MVQGTAVFARASLAGNPSDGFGGAVCAVVVPHLHATVIVSSGDAPDEV